MRRDAAVVRLADARPMQLGHVIDADARLRLFLFAPALNLLRFDLNEAQLWFLGQRWSLGIDAFRAGEISANEAAMRIFLRAFLPAIVVVVAFLGVAWRYGRLYCGWLCPHFTLVETLNMALHRACGKLSFWDKHRTARAGVKPSARWWPVFGALCLGFGFIWAITLLSYLLPPATIWGNLFAGTLTPNQARFLVIGTAVFTAEFAFARHLVAEGFRHRRTRPLHLVQVARDDALLVWNAIREWARQYVWLYYADDNAVVGDTELAAWADSLAGEARITGFGPRDRQISGGPAIKFAEFPDFCLREILQT